MVQAADAAAQSSVGFWSPFQYTQFLEQAIGALDSIDPSLSFRLVGRMVQDVSGAKLKLSPQESQFLRLLIERLGKPVKTAELKSVGIVYPAKVKGGIVKKFRIANIELPIQASKDAYLLLESEA